MAGLDLERLAQQAEGFARARAVRRLRHLAGTHAGLGLAPLYEVDYPSFESRDLFADLLDAPAEDAAQKRSLVGFMAAAHVEGRTRAFAEQVARFEARTTVPDARGDEEVAWRSAPRRWTLSADVAARHTLYGGWLEAVQSGVSSTLARWQEAQTAALHDLLGGEGAWLPFWAEQRGVSLPGASALAESVLATGAETFRNTLRVYLLQVGLPIDDSWPADVDWAFRATRFDADFPHARLMPSLVRTFRHLGIEIEDQISAGNIRLDLEERPAKAVASGVCVWLEVPNESHVLARLAGGHQDVGHVLRGLGQAQHVYHTDRSFGFAERWLGDETPTRAYGYLMQDLLLEPAWLREVAGLEESGDFRVVAHLARQYRVRRMAALVGHVQRVWSEEPGGGLAADYAERLSAALHTRHFAETYLLPLRGGPWSALDPLIDLRAQVFAAQLRQFLRAEFDEDWFFNRRAGQFLVQELWRAGRRHSAEDLLRFMGYGGFDASILCGETMAVLSAV